MTTVDIQKVKTHLSRLVDEAANGNPFIITKASKPMVKVVALHAPSGNKVRRLGFLKGQFLIPVDFNTMGSEAIERLFSGR